jgi:hypothetical protein
VGANAAVFASPMQAHFQSALLLDEAAERERRGRQSLAENQK